ncbi:MAG: site-2 protease family protein [Oscillospiraceae bacterium]|nr:site-2 protease family protein [Oscillospiraceae bacterium]
MRGAIFDVFDFMTGKIDMITMVLSVFSVLVILFLCFPLHECAHALVAHLLGDDTASEQGRLTLNPLSHIDPMGALCMAVCSIGWAKPTPVSLHRCRKVSIRTADILVSAAGPVSNILMALVFIIISKILLVAVELTPTMFYIILGLEMTAEINTYLAVINLIPVPPFDGYSLIQGILPRKTAIWIEERAQIIHFIVFVLLVSGALRRPLGYASNGILWVLDKITWFIR